MRKKEVIHWLVSIEKYQCTTIKVLNNEIIFSHFNSVYEPDPIDESSDYFEVVYNYVLEYYKISGKAIGAKVPISDLITYLEEK